MIPSGSVGIRICLAAVDGVDRAPHIPYRLPLVRKAGSRAVCLVAGVDRVGDESHRAVAERQIGAPGMVAAGRVRSELPVGAVIAVGARRTIRRDDSIIHG